jgi:Chaperone of endosialidase/Head domain of trimeric autotransporter adhesin
MPTGTGTRMVWNPRKRAFRAGIASGTQWTDANVGEGSVAFGQNTTASGSLSMAFGNSNVASGVSSTAFGNGSNATGSVSTAFGNSNATGSHSTSFGNSTNSTGNNSTAFGNFSSANGENSTAFGYSSLASAENSTSFGENSSSSGKNATSFGNRNAATSYAETVFGIGATTYTTSINGATQFRIANATDRLLVIGNAIDADNDDFVDTAERSDAMVILKNGNTGIGSSTPQDKLHVVGKIRMVDGNQATGKILVSDTYGTATWTTPTAAGGTLDQAYDFGGAGLGKAITADAGAVLINGTDGLVSTGTAGSGVVIPSGAGTRMVWNPRKAAFRAGTVSGTQWDDANVGSRSTAFGNNSVASGTNSNAFGSSVTASGAESTAIGFGNSASGANSTAMGESTLASGINSTAFGFLTRASGSYSTTFGNNTEASGTRSSAFGQDTVAFGSLSSAFGLQNTASSYGETVLGIGATNYTPSAFGSTQFRTANATDRLLVVGNAIDVNNSSVVDLAERRDALVILKNGNTGIGSSTPQDKLHVVGKIRMVDGNEAAGKILVSDANGTATWTTTSTIASGTLDQAYDFGGAGLGKTITADAGAVLIDGTDGLVSTGTIGSGIVMPTGAGTRMVWNPRKAAFRAGNVSGNQWDDANVGTRSIAFGQGTIASGTNSTALGNFTTASGSNSTVFGVTTVASGGESTAFGVTTVASGNESTAFGSNSVANGTVSSAFGRQNTASSYGETTLGIGATTYVPSINGATQFRTANVTDRLLVVGNAIDADNDGNVDVAERSDALVILKNGNTGIGISTPQRTLHVATGLSGVTPFAGAPLVVESSGDAYQHFLTPNTLAATGAGLLFGTPAGSIRGGIVYSPLAEKLDFRTGGNTVRMTLTNVGNLGIGTPTPLDKLHVVGNIRMVDGNEAAGNILVSDANGTATWTTTSTIASGTLDQSYDFGGAGLGKTITADAGAVLINGTDGLVSTGTSGSGAVAPTGAGTRMVWNPRKSAFRAGRVFGTEWDDAQIGFHSSAFGIGTIASGNSSTAFGSTTDASGDFSTAFGNFSTASGIYSFAFGLGSRASGQNSTASGHGNTASSYGETVLGIGATTYTPSINGASQFRTANATDRLLVVGNAIDSNSTGVIDLTERSDALVILKNGNTGIGTSTPGGQLELSLNQGRKPGTNTWTIVSDQRLKTINGNYTKGLNEILQLNPIRFNYKNNGDRKFEEEVLETEFPGFIAQEVQPLFPDAVGTDADGFLNFNIHPILIASVNAFKELDAKNKQLTVENEALKSELNRQKQLIASILLRLNVLEK